MLLFGNRTALVLHRYTQGAALILARTRHYSTYISQGRLLCLAERSCSTRGASREVGGETRG